jgi:hypothetical protein
MRKGVVVEILANELFERDYYAAGCWVVEAAHIVEVPGG